MRGYGLNVLKSFPVVGSGRVENVFLLAEFPDTQVESVRLLGQHILEQFERMERTCP
ncbi:hypothetical protein A2U01_0091790 [Trifolium medium]|uniref:Uncharacterized protein n=1 Tax=Trifolium medium TaxID=97028 RepID=A0A392UCF3_9FABA|nr:hypothetical protein [Trifolium medium]